MSSESKQTIGSAGLISLAAFGGAIIGFFLQLLVAYYFGASQATDAFFMAQSTSEMLNKLLLGGSIASVFLPIFVAQIAQGNRTTAWSLGLNILHISGLIVIILATLLAIFATPFVRFIAPGFDNQTTTLTVALLRVLVPSFAFLFLVNLATSMLQALRHFIAPAILRIVAPLVSLLFVALLAPTIGIYSYALGVVVGSIVQLALLFYALHRVGMSYHFIFRPTDPNIKRIFSLVYPFIFSALATQGAGIVYRVLVSELSIGSLSSLKYAEKITQLLTIMFLGSVTYVIYPLLAEKAAKHDFQGMRETIAGAIRLIGFVALPVIAGVVILREPLITFLYQRGDFTPHDTAMTSIALLWFILGLLTNGISSVFGYATLSLQQTRAAVAITTATQAIAIYLFVLLVPRMGHEGLALGSSLVPLSIALLNFLFLSRFIPQLYRVFWHVTYIKIIFLVILMVGLVLWIKQTFPLPNSASQAALLIHLLIPATGGAILFLTGAFLLRIPEMNDAISIILDKPRKWRRKII